MSQFSHSSVSIDLHEVSNVLSRLRVPGDLIESALRAVPEEVMGLMIYGSRARGDFLDHSDLDLLALVSRRIKSRKYDGVNVSCYTASQIVGASGTLFGMHIRRDGIMIADPTGELQGFIQDLKDPEPSRLTARIRHFSAILEASQIDTENYLEGLCRLARFLLRTAIYAETLRHEQPCFSVRELAVRFDEPSLTTLLSSDPSIVAEASLELFERLRKRLQATVGIPPTTHYSSLESLVVDEWHQDREFATLALFAMIDQHTELDYSELSNVFL